MTRTAGTKGDITERLPRHDEMLEFDPDEFATAFGWAMNAVAGEAHIQDPTEIRLTFIDEDDEELQYHFADTPLARILIAMRERYLHVNKLKYYSASNRILALLDLLRTGRLGRWTRPEAGGGDATEIHDSVIAAAAVVRLNRRLHFPVREFLRKVREIDAAR